MALLNVPSGPSTANSAGNTLQTWPSTTSAAGLSSGEGFASPCQVGNAFASSRQDEMVLREGSWFGSLILGSRAAKLMRGVPEEWVTARQRSTGKATIANARTVCLQLDLVGPLDGRLRGRTELIPVNGSSNQRDTGLNHES